LAFNRIRRGGAFVRYIALAVKFLPMFFHSRRTHHDHIPLPSIFLLEAGEVSRFHRLQCDELWHFYAGDALLLHLLSPSRGYRAIQLGSRPDRNDAFLAVFSAGDWFAAEVRQPGDYSLVGCTVAPGFAFADLEIAARRQLVEEYPAHRDLILRLTGE
jgi:hypothetical protein